MTKCILCSNMEIHCIEYNSLETGDGWSGCYCSKCFVKKLRGMAKAWDKK